MNAGRLDRRLTLQTRTVTKDADGGRVETWQDEKQIWAQLIPASSNKAIVADAERESQTVMFKIRSMTIEASENRLIYKGEKYEITGVDEDGPRGTYLKISTRRISALV
jgi:SPP1 family predicted phage head-tail adaptor